jgi:hypothetical protein
MEPVWKWRGDSLAVAKTWQIRYCGQFVEMENPRLWNDRGKIVTVENSSTWMNRGYGMNEE